MDFSGLLDLNLRVFLSSGWNKYISKINQLRVFAGIGIKLERTKTGTIVSRSYKDQNDWHPWFTKVEYDKKSKQFICKIDAGFVNGLAPTYREMSLLENPVIELNRFGTAERIPAFFRQMGITNEDQSMKLNLKTGTLLLGSDTNTKPNTQKLLKTDLYMSTARATYQLNSSVIGNLVMGQIVDYNVGYSTTNLDIYGHQTRIYTDYEMPAKPTVIDIINGNITGDDGEDRLLIATVYLLSPEDEESETDLTPNEKWSIYVQHNIFWNLAYFTKNDPPENWKQTEKDGFLAWYVGRYTVAPMATLGAMEAEVQRAYAVVANMANNEGKYWTI